MCQVHVIHNLVVVHSSGTICSPYTSYQQNLATSGGVIHCLTGDRYIVIMRWGRCRRKWKWLSCLIKGGGIVIANVRTVSRVGPSFSATDPIASHCDPYSCWCSNTIRTARSRISTGYLPGRRCSVMAPSSQGLEPPPIPGRFRIRLLRRVEFGYHDPEPPIIVASHTPAATHPNPTPKLTHRYVRRAT